MYIHDVGFEFLYPLHYYINAFIHSFFILIFWITHIIQLHALPTTHVCTDHLFNSQFISQFVFPSYSSRTIHLLNVLFSHNLFFNFSSTRSSTYRPSYSVRFSRFILHSFYIFIPPNTFLPTSHLYTLLSSLIISFSYCFSYFFNFNSGSTT